MVIEHVPAPARALIEGLTGALREIPGVAAVALGGSYARGTQHAGSDVDLGLYYAEAAPFSVAAIRRVADHVAVRPPVVTDFYEWGPWVNGGAWIPTRIGKVDFLYRNVDQVRRVIEDARHGKIELHYGQQPPFGFHSVIYLGETEVTVPLHDPQGILLALKRSVSPYPPALQHTIIREYLWAVEFTLLFGRDAAARADVYSTAGCLTRAFSYLTQVMFALNERYFISDKGALQAIAAFPVTVPAYADRVTRVLARPGATAAELSATVADLEALFRDVVALAGDRYRPKYVL